MKLITFLGKITLAVQDDVDIDSVTLGDFIQLELEHDADADLIGYTTLEVFDGD